MKPSDALDLVALYEASYNRDVPDHTRKLWIVLFADVARAPAFLALNEMAATTAFPPTPQSIRLRTLEIEAGLVSFGEVWRELVDAASTCDYFDPNPPSTLSPVARALARSLGWADFRASDPTDTYYVHHAEQRYTELTDRVRRRLTNGLPAFEAWERPALSNGYGELVDGIGGEE